jgi:hypothetical protein
MQESFTNAQQGKSFGDEFPVVIVTVGFTRLALVVFFYFLQIEPMNAENPLADEIEVAL